jgi:phytoene dehydrogenase-like protein
MREAACLPAVAFLVTEGGRQPSPGKVVAIDGGIAGLCTAVYARKCGYDVELLEMHDTAGGLATSWHRGGYVFETCLHWLMGSNPRRPFHKRWREMFDIDRLQFVEPEEFTRIETEHGESLPIYTDAGRMEAELLRRARRMRERSAALPKPFDGSWVRDPRTPGR